MLDVPPLDWQRHTRVVRRACDAVAAFAVLVDDAAVLCRAATGLSTSDAERTLPVIQPLCRHVAAHGKPLLGCDLPQDHALAAQPTATAAKVAAFAGVPLRLDAQVVGVLCVVASAPRAWDDADVQTLRDVAAGLEAELAQRVLARRHARAEASFKTVSETLRLAMAAACVSTFEWDIPHDHVAWSDNLEGFLGLAPGTFGGTFDAFMALVHPEDAARVRTALVQAMHERGGYSCDFRMLRSDGAVRWTRTRGRIECDPEGRPLRLFGVDIDVTQHQQALDVLDRERARLAQALQEQSQAEQALRDREQHLRLSMQAATMLCFEWDIQRDEVRRLFSTEDTLAETGERPVRLADMVRAIHPDDRERFHATLRSALDSDDGAYTCQFRILRPDGSVRWFSDAGRVVFDAEHRPVRLLGVSHDETERQQLELERERHITLLQQDDRRKDEFLAVLAHELRNPLAPIRNAVQLLARHDSADPVVAQARRIIDRQSAHLARMVEDLLDVSRVTAGKVVLQRSVLEARAVVEAGVEVARPLIEARRQRLLLALPPLGPLAVEGDPARLTQALGNLVTNAAKFTPEGGRIEVGLSRAGDGMLEISVCDTGRGMEAELLPRVFDLFVQAPGSSSSGGGGGLGIGLALVRKLAQLHGGDVSAHSEGPGLGSRFIMTLPEANASPALPPQESTPGAAQAMQRRRVLVVDDIPDAAQSLALLLEAEGCLVSICHGGEQARERACMESFDVVLLDLGLPDVDGLAVARAIRGGGASRHATLIAVTGHGQPEDHVRSTQAGFDAHLVKPVELPALRAHMNRDASLEARLLARMGHPVLHRFYSVWRELRGAAPWPMLQPLLEATSAWAPQRVVGRVLTREPDFTLRFEAIGTALALLLPHALVGKVVGGPDAAHGAMEDAYQHVAMTGQASHESVDYHFAPNDGLHFERLIVPATDVVAAGEPTHLLAMVLIEPLP